MRRINTVPKYIDGRGARLLFVGRSGDVVRLENPHGNKYSTNFSFRNFLIYGNNRADVGLRVKGTQRTVISSIAVSRTRTAVMLHADRKHGIYNNLFEDIATYMNRENGLWLYSAGGAKLINGNTFADLYLARSGNIGLKIAGAASNVFIPGARRRDVVLWEGSATPMWLRTISDFEMIDARVYSYKETAIKLSSPARGIYFGNRIHASRKVSGLGSACGYIIKTQAGTTEKLCR